MNQSWCFFVLGFLSALRVWCNIQQLVVENLVERAEGDKVADRYFVGTVFIAGILCLRSSEDFRDLGQIIVFPEAV